MDTNDLFVLANQQPQTRAGVRQRATRIAQRARREMTRLGYGDVKLEEHISPNSRYGMNIVADVDGLNDTQKRRVRRALRRAAGKR